MKQRTETLNARQRLASQLLQRRKIFDLSQEALADLAGLHRTYVGSIERCERNVSIDNIEKLASALHTDIAELLAKPDITEVAR
jgi:transcriptional regulator with XRE-family HTH domain